VVIDGSQSLGEEDQKALEAARQAPHAVGILSKSDLPQVVKAEQLGLSQVISLSAKTGAGLQQLAPMVETMFSSSVPCDGSLLTNSRHIGAITRARDAIGRAQESMSLGETPDAVLLDVEEALEAIAEVTGKSMREDITSDIFSRFCVGK
jgi:tRNA modification GTPase